MVSVNVVVHADAPRQAIQRLTGLIKQAVPKAQLHLFKIRFTTKELETDLSKPLSDLQGKAVVVLDPFTSIPSVESSQVQKLVKSLSLCQKIFFISFFHPKDNNETHIAQKQSYLESEAEKFHRRLGAIMIDEGQTQLTSDQLLYLNTIFPVEFPRTELPLQTPPQNRHFWKNVLLGMVGTLALTLAVIAVFKVFIRLHRSI